MTSGSRDHESAGTISLDKCVDGQNSLWSASVYIAIRVTTLTARWSARSFFAFPAAGSSRSFGQSVAFRVKRGELVHTQGEVSKSCPLLGALEGGAG